MIKTEPKTPPLPMIPTASVLGVGTELTSGQITNKNGSWISKKLRESGLKTNTHIVVPDERTLILQALDFCALQSHIIFVTGGLGPTSDDFTRDLICQWTGLKTFFDDPSWKKVVERLSSRGFAVQDFQKQQCYFPDGVQVLENQHGTANGFYLYAKEKHFFVLPGPPREIESIWNDHIENWLQQNTKHIDPLVTKSWDTIGEGESEIARRTELASQGVNPTPDFEKTNSQQAPQILEIGYRVHLPYVEVKATFHKSDQSRVSSYLEKIDETLKDVTVLRNSEDIAELFCQRLLDYEKVYIQDEATDGFLTHRIQNHWKSLLAKTEIHFSNKITNLKITDLQSKVSKVACLQLKKVSDFEAESLLLISLAGTDQKIGLNRKIQSPYKTANMIERSKQMFTELALIEWMKSL